MEAAGSGAGRDAIRGPVVNIGTRPYKVYGAGLMAAALLLGACGGTPSGKAHATGTSATAASAPAAVRIAVTKWRHDGGTAQINLLAQDFTTMGTSTQDWQMATGCYVLLLDAHASQQAAPIPDPAAQRLWSSALGAYARGALECGHGADAHNDGMVARATAEFGTGTSYIKLLRLRLDDLSQP